MTDKALDNTNMEQATASTPDIKVHGDPGAWVCVCKASSANQGWMKSTKVLNLPTGCIVQASTEIRGRVAEAITWVPGIRYIEGEWKVVH